MQNRIRSPGILVAALALLVCLGVAVAFAENIDPFDAGDQYAWGENVGWMNAEPANCSDCGLEVTDTDLTGYMWGENIGWISLSCTNVPASCRTADYGVTNDGAGNLAGYAWGENVGWISFSDDAPVEYGVTINTATGVFSGYAWGENIGWISFSDDAPVPYRVTTSWPGVTPTPTPTPTDCTPGVDTDGDGFDDGVECYLGTDPGDDCPDGPTDDAWPLDINMSGDITVTGDVFYYVGKIGMNDTQPEWTPEVQRLDLNASGDISVTGDIFLYVGKIGATCT